MIPSAAARLSDARLKSKRFFINWIAAATRTPKKIRSRAIAGNPALEHDLDEIVVRMVEDRRRDAREALGGLIDRDEGAEARTREPVVM